MAKEKEIKTEGKVALHPYYAMVYWKLVAFFKGDPDIEVLPIDDEKNLCTIKCKTLRKKELLEKWLKNSFESDDGEKLDIKVTLDKSCNPVVEELRDLLSTNAHFHSAYSYEQKPTPTTPPFKTVVLEMKDEAVHYFSDNMFNPVEHDTTLAENLVKELFNEDLLNFSVVTHENINLVSTLCTTSGCTTPGWYLTGGDIKWNN